ncbi:MerR family transcriptional regulator [Microbacterium sp. SORGH_AS_0888]|uniref:MerR family transcriptional regulator n=1 Tax=Microbacterium sp. SORGH_AS_0888 TaxID=3041791 RepID=UPI0027849E5E|nr:MerR family transcriptional regulator [Microbacterium sp. SORGH_AS_0888]MDQ1128271.1 DNA-binding transcriptional MerR regulator [Microbacterium sp. SORGH_AS_0888]
MRIGEVSRRTGVAARMLRYYEEQDLLRPRRHPNGYRDYTDVDLEQVATIRDLSSAGVPTRFIKIVLERQAGTTVWTSACDDILAGMVREQIADLDVKIASLTTSKHALSQFLDEAASGTGGAARR